MATEKNTNRAGTLACAFLVSAFAASSVFAGPASPKGDAAASKEAESFVYDCSPSDPKECARDRANFIRDYLRAMAGNYQGQRNVAFMLSTGDAPVVKNRIQGCAWRFVIVQSGHADADASDAMNLKTDCGRLNNAERATAAARTAEIMRQIERRTSRR